MLPGNLGCRPWCLADRVVVWEELVDKLHEVVFPLVHVHLVVACVTQNKRRVYESVFYDEET